MLRVVHGGCSLEESGPDLVLGQFNLRFVCIGEAGMWLAVWLAWACLGVGPRLRVGPRLNDVYTKCSRAPTRATFPKAMMVQWFGSWFGKGLGIYLAFLNFIIVVFIVYGPFTSYEVLVVRWRSRAPTWCWASSICVWKDLKDLLFVWVRLVCGWHGPV